jgi:hypothetical protein
MTFMGVRVSRKDAKAESAQAAKSSLLSRGAGWRDARSPKAFRPSGGTKVTALPAQLPPVLIQNLSNSLLNGGNIRLREIPFVVAVEDSSHRDPVRVGRNDRQCFAGPAGTPSSSAGFRLIASVVLHPSENINVQSYDEKAVRQFCKQAGTWDNGYLVRIVHELFRFRDACREMRVGAGWQ